MVDQSHIPDEFVLARTTNVFDEQSVPPGLLKAHRVADGTWGRLVVHEGVVRLMFEDAPQDVQTVKAHSSAVIPPTRPHHLELDGPARFAVEFYSPAPGV